MYDEVTPVLQAPFNILLSLETSREFFSSLWTWFLPQVPNTFLFLNSLFCYQIGVGGWTMTSLGSLNSYPNVSYAK